MLNVITAGSENMVDYVTDYLGAEVRGDASRTSRSRSSAPGRAMPARRRSTRSSRRSRQAGAEQWRRRRRGGASEDGRPDGRGGPARPSTGTTSRPASWSARDTAKNALGTDVERLRDADVPQPDRDRLQPGADAASRRGSYAELAAWVEENPGQFGYNGIKNGMTGVAFVVGWIYSQHRRRRPADERPVRRGAQGDLVTTRWPSSRSSTSTSPSRRATPARSTC